MPFEPLGGAEVVERGPGRVRLRAGTTTVEVTALAADLYRVGVFPEGKPPDYRSEAIASGYEPGGGVPEIALDPLRVGGDAFELETGIPSHGVADLLGRRLRLLRPRGAGERFFGCGERTSGLEKTGSRQVFWNVDPPQGHTASFNNLYTSIPFTLSLRDGRASGFFLDNAGRVELDLAKADPNLVTGVCRGTLVYYVFTAETPAAVLERYTELTGRTPMPPLWALGNQQSRWGYENENDVRGIAREFRARGIPCDVVYLDIDYMDG
jgi:alpha-glucosidase